MSLARAQGARAAERGPGPHLTWTGRSLAALLAVTCLLARPASGQEEAAAYRVSWGDAVSVGLAGALYLLPRVAGLPHGAASCAPCDPATLPGFDRWALRSPSPGLDGTSTLVVAGVGGLTAIGALGGLSAAQWQGNLATLASAAGWTAASAEWLKVLFARNRPVLYTSEAVAAAGNRGSRLSFPSAHTALAFAAATSYLVVAERQRLKHRTRHAVLLFAGAAGVGVLRVAAGEHFPSDVLGGAVLGAGVGWLVPTIHPTAR